ncbi:hypothetical protein CBOM_00530 [Ceraceosorus bombacis]|uniref:Uncharacterized protein n=1 Tax=Ceraceosorus bombacis TaxID=401625 RepID=A0A0N7L919_9BASI|nr:hypothetical protein CBOM_00530 [Ceraceosorus bombacis]
MSSRELDADNMVSMPKDLFWFLAAIVILAALFGTLGGVVWLYRCKWRTSTETVVVDVELGAMQPKDQQASEASRNRERELLARIADLESKSASKDLRHE